MRRLWQGMRSTVQADRGSPGLLQRLLPEAQASKVLVAPLDLDVKSRARKVRADETEFPSFSLSIHYSEVNWKFDHARENMDSTNNDLIIARARCSKLI